MQCINFSYQQNHVSILREREKKKTLNRSEETTIKHDKPTPDPSSINSS